MNNSFTKNTKNGLSTVQSTACCKKKKSRARV